jgi:Flp pilus assembly protein TadD
MRVHRRHSAMMAAALGLVTILAFLPALDCGFVAYDDPQGSPEHAILLRGVSLEGVAWAFRELDFFGNWLPLTLLSHMLDWELYGAEARGHHLTSLALHAGSVVLLFLLWQRATGRAWRAAAVAALWAVHPLRVEPVVWVAARKDMLSGLFGLAALLLYVEWSRRPSAGRRAALVAAFVLALLSKSMVMTLPAVMLLLDVWPLGRLPLPPAGSLRERAGALARAAWPLVREKALLLLLAAAAGALAFLTQRWGGAMADLGARPAGTRLAVAALAVPRYLEALVWPTDLVPFYPLPPGSPPWVLAALAAVSVVAGTAFVLVRARRWPWLCCGWLWFLVMLLPVSGIVQVGEQSHADRYTYLPSIGLLVALVWSGGEALRRRPAWRPIAATAVVVVVVAWGAATRAQIPRWRSSSALFEYMLAADPDNPMAHINLGVQRAAEGRLREAVRHARRAIALRPDIAGSYNNLGTALARLGDRPGARAAFEDAIRRDPALASAHFNLAVLLADAGEPGLAVGHLARTVSLEPEYARAWQGLAALLADPAVAAQARPFVEALRRDDPASPELRRVAELVAAGIGGAPADRAP